MANDLTKVNDLQNSLLESIQTVVNKALFQLDKDVTKICTITNIDKRSTGEYTVKDEVVEYQAYSADSSLTLDDRVYVLVPNGNQNNQKLIIGKVLTEKEAPYIYRSPFESIIETSSNLASGTAEMELIANVENIPGYTFDEIKISEEKPEDFKVTIKGTDYTITKEKLYELGLESARKFYNLFKGTVIKKDGQIENFSSTSYCFKTISVEESIDEILGLKFDIKTLLNTCNSGTYGVRLGISGKIQGESAYRIVEFTNEEMFGNTYNFSAFATQEKTFDVGAFESISQIDVLFFQGNDFITKDNKELSYRLVYDEYHNLLKDEIVPNIFLDNLYICFGKAIPTTGADYAFISCAEGKHYSRYNIETDGVRVEKKEKANDKSLVLKWLHNFEDGSYRLAKLNSDKTAFEETELADYYFDFYKYDIGSAGDPNGGVFWQKITGDNNKNPTLIFTPDVDLQNELIKVVITKKVNDSYTMILTSDILTLENDEKVNNRTVAEYLADLVIKPDDETNGQYYIYNEAGQLIDSTQAEKRRWFNFALLKNKISLSGDDYLKIDFPTEKTMFEFYTYKDNESENPSKITDGHILIKPKGSETINLTMENKKDEDETDSKLPYFYKIKYYNNPSYINNTVKVTLQVSKKLYYAEINMGFGIQGTKGTERTLIVELAGNYPYIYKPSSWVLEFYDLNIFLQDEKGNIVDLNKGDINTDKLSLSWYNKSISDNKFLTFSNENSENKYKICADWSKSEIKDYNAFSLNPEKYIYILKVDFLGGDTIIWKKDSEGNDVSETIKLNALEAYLPIPIRSQYEIAMVSGPTSVYYLSDGSTEFQKAPYEIDNDNGTFKIVVDDDDFITKEKAWVEAQKKTTMTDEEKNKIKKAYDAAKAFVGELDDENKLKVPTFYLKDSPNYAVLAKTKNGNFFGIYPILVLQNKYPSRVINKWDGKTLTIDNDNGLILSTAIAAGKKNPDNTFSGVMLGDWSNTPSTSDLRAQTGIYGFHNGEMSYAFKEDGTAFIGTSSNGGRIEFNGNSGLIKSANYDTIHQGMEINLGSYSDSKLTPPKITMKASDIDSTIKAIEIGENFNVDWNGNIWTKGGTITAGTLKSYTEKNNNQVGIISLDGYLNVFKEDDQGSIVGLMGRVKANTGETNPIKDDGIGFIVQLSDNLNDTYTSKFVAAIGSAGISYRDYFIALSDNGINIGKVEGEGIPKGKISFTNVDVDMKAYAVFG